MIRLALALIGALACAEEHARDLGVRFPGDPGKLNAITDVAGVEVGHTTLIEGDKVRTGVTVVFPRGKDNLDPAFGGWSLNGNGEMTGTAWLEESGLLDGPILITNTHSVGMVRDSYIQWLARNRKKPGTNTFGDSFWALPVVTETFDGYLNDVNGFHVKPEHVEQAIASASAGKVAEGNVGGGTGMIC
jgi:D-aminopeptidase